MLDSSQILRVMKVFHVPNFFIIAYLPTYFIFNYLPINILQQPKNINSQTVVSEQIIKQTIGDTGSEPRYTQ